MGSRGGSRCFSGLVRRGVRGKGILGIKGIMVWGNVMFLGDSIIDVSLIHVFAKTSLGKNCLRTNGKEHEQVFWLGLSIQSESCLRATIFIAVGAYGPILGTIGCQCMKVINQFTAVDGNVLAGVLLAQAGM